MDSILSMGTAYQSREIHLSEPNSVRWDGGNTVDRRQLIAEITDRLLREQEDLCGCNVRLHHADGRLLAKTVLHEPLFPNAT
jgi:hypothetical protein